MRESILLPVVSIHAERILYTITFAKCKIWLIGRVKSAVNALDKFGNFCRWQWGSVSTIVAGGSCTLSQRVFHRRHSLSCNFLISSEMSGLYKSKTSLTLILAGDQSPTFFGKRFVIVNSGLVRQYTNQVPIANGQGMDNILSLD